MPKESVQSGAIQSAHAVASSAERFPPHPGHITHHFDWNDSDKIVDAKEVPDGVKFIYYDAHGRETSDLEHAVRRVPVIRSVIVSVDAKGSPASPQRAAHVSISDYGTDGQFLRHTEATGTP